LVGILNYLLEQSIECDVSWQGKEGLRLQGYVRLPAVTGLL